MTTGIPKKHSHLTGQNRVKVATQLKAAYEKGASIRALSETSGRSYGMVYRLLKETGVALRSRSGHPRSASTS